MLRVRKVHNITATETYNIFFSISMASNCDLSQYEGKQIKSDKVITLSNLQNFLSRKEQKKRIVIKYLVPASIYVRRRMIMVLNCHNSKKASVIPYQYIANISCLIFYIPSNNLDYLSYRWSTYAKKVFAQSSGVNSRLHSEGKRLWLSRNYSHTVQGISEKWIIFRPQSLSWKLSVTAKGSVPTLTVIYLRNLTLSITQ